MTKIRVSGVIELRPQSFVECPEYTTLGLRTYEEELVEVFLPTELVTTKPEQYQAGQSLSLIGGEWHYETGPAGDYRRFWPAAVGYDA